MAGATPLRRKIAILGFRGVGKSSLARQLAEERFEEEYEPTIVDTIEKELEVSGVMFSLHIVDTAGQDDFSRIPKEACLGVHGYVLVYDVSSPFSLERMRGINDRLLEALGVESVPRVLVGNKSDVTGKELVPEEDGRKLAREFGCPFLQSSARLDEHVTEAFELLLYEIEKGNSTLPPPASSGPKPTTPASRKPAHGGSGGGKGGGGGGGGSCVIS